MNLSGNCLEISVIWCYMNDDQQPEQEKRLHGPKVGPKAKQPPARDQEVEDEEDNVEAHTEAVMHQQEILDQLKAAKGAEARVRTFAKIMDSYGLDPILSLFTGVGDASMGAIAGLYLIYEAKKAGLSKWDYLKIVGLQAADFFIGAVPIVGDIADFVIKANKASVPMFKDRVEELVTEARAAGVSEEAIAKLSISADKLPQLVDHAIAVHKKVKAV